MATVVVKWLKRVCFIHSCFYWKTDPTFCRQCRWSYGYMVPH